MLEIFDSRENYCLVDANETNGMSSNSTEPVPDENELKRLSESLGMSLEAVQTMMSSAGGTINGAVKSSGLIGTPPMTMAPTPTPTTPAVTTRGRKRSSLTKSSGKSPLWSHFRRGAKMPGIK